MSNRLFCKPVGYEYRTPIYWDTLGTRYYMINLLRSMYKEESKRFGPYDAREKVLAYLVFSSIVSIRKQFELEPELNPIQIAEETSKLRRIK